MRRKYHYFMDEDGVIYGHTLSSGAIDIAGNESAAGMVQTDRKLDAKGKHYDKEQKRLFNISRNQADDSPVKVDGKVVKVGAGLDISADVKKEIIKPPKAKEVEGVK